PATSVTIDTNEGGADVTPPPVIEAIVEDTGHANDDGITKENVILVTGSSDEDDGAEVAVTIRDSANAVVATLTATVSGGVWSTGQTGILSDGAYTITATQRDAAGNDPSAASDPFTMVIDTNNGGANPTPAPTVTGIDQDDGLDPNDGITSDQTLYFLGTAEANAVVHVFLDGVEIGSVIAEPTGAWRYDHTGTTLNDGVYQVSAQQVDAAGNDASPRSEEFQVVVSTALPTVSIEMMSNDFGLPGDFITHATETQISGSATPNSLIDIQVDGVSVATAVADGNGFWTSDLIDLSAYQVGDQPEITAVATGPNGKTNEDVQAITIERNISDIGLLPEGMVRKLVGDHAADQLGSSISAIGDINNDGFEDFIVGARGDDLAGTNAGTAYVVFGKADGRFFEGSVADLTPEDGFVFRAFEGGSRFAETVSRLGDINGDGIDDFGVGSPGENARNRTDSGVGYVIFGQDSADASAWGSLEGGRQVLRASNIRAAHGFVAMGREGINSDETRGDQLRIAGYVGDINNDGIADIVMSAPGADFGTRLNSGDIVVIFGKSGANGSAWVTDGTPARPTYGAGTVSSANGFNITGDFDLANLNSFMNSAGDINGDGINDLVFGSYKGSIGAANSGTLYVVFGKAGAGGGAAVGNDFANAQWNGPRLNLRQMSSSDGFLIAGDTPNAAMRHGCIGDLNGDGIADVHGFSDSALGGRGAVYVVWGRTDGSWGSIENGRAVVRTANLAPEDGMIVRGISGINIKSVSVEGDVNGDGLDDMVIGAETSFGKGVVYVLYGDNDFSWAPTENGRRIVDLIDLPRDKGFLIRGESDGDLTGSSVDVADLNGDGYADILMGSRGLDEGGLADRGAAYVVFGQSGDFAVGITDVGTAGADWLAGTDYGDVLIGEGGADHLLGFGGDDMITISDLEFAKIDGGSGQDVLRLDGGGLDLNLSEIENERLTGIDGIDLTGAGTDSVQLSEQDVLDMSDAGLVKLRGDIDDSATASGFTDSGADQTENGVTYDVYTSGAATLWIDQQLSVTI
ncbi:Ig-like domain-containing protein, partial [Nitratireductor sp. CH_MIT9313-5]|uniref:Ig-like domain-containing protein n=1 Tax=Nitratireductor sp. CH_MIT9313-5 TaxID=3107764 RepID=UPI00300B58BD